jgi:hypothetical protein
MGIRLSPSTRFALAAVTAITSVAVGINVSTAAAGTVVPGAGLTAHSIAKAKPAKPPRTTTSMSTSTPTSTVDSSGWPCLKVLVQDWDGTWVWITVVAPDAPSGTFCGA